jgi:hypothetical protein
MRLLARIALLAALAAGVTLAAAPAAQPPKGKDKAKDQAPPPAEPKTADEDKAAATAKLIERIADAHKLMELADAQKAPEMYIVAGRLFLQVNDLAEKVLPLEAVPEVQTEDGKPVAGAKAESEKGDSFKTLAAKAFEQAEVLANEQKSFALFIPVVKAVKANPWVGIERGAVGGPKLITRPLAPGQSHVYTIAFDTATPGAIGFAASVPMRCQMRTGNYVHFNQVVRSGQYSWQPKRNEPARTYVINIHNGTNAVGTYRLFTN